MFFIGKVNFRKKASEARVLSGLSEGQAPSGYWGLGCRMRGAGPGPFPALIAAEVRPRVAPAWM